MTESDTEKIAEDELALKDELNKLQEASKIVDVILQDLVDYCKLARVAKVAADADPE